VLAHGTQDLSDPVTAEAEPVLVEAARRLDPPRLRRVIAHLCLAADPDGTDRELERRHTRRGVWLAPTLDGMVAVDGFLEPEAGQLLLAALEPLARPVDANDARSGSQRRADALAELARRALESGRLPRPAGSARSSRSPWTWTASWAAAMPLVVRPARWVRWIRRRVGGWPVMGR